MSAIPLTACLCCGSRDLREVLNLGSQPLANSYASSLGETLAEYPLALNVCGRCWHAQLSVCVDRREIFDHYAYVSGTSNTLRKYFQWFAAALASHLPARGRVLEIAANDGSLVKELRAVGLDCVGVDPARNIVEAAQATGLPLTCGYWPAVASDVPGQFDSIVAMNVVAHVDDPRDFVAACREKLTPNGVLIIQTSQARMFGNHEFDTVYHEHVSFFNTHSMANLAQSAGLELCGTAMTKIHGDSAVFMLCRPGAAAGRDLSAAFRDGEFGIDERLQAYEQRTNLYDWLSYDGFRRQSKAIVRGLSEEVARRRDQGFEVVCVGAAAKAMTVLNAAGIRPDRLLDESPLKIGRYSPGIRTIVERLDTCRNIERPGFFVITAWNFRRELAAKLRAIGVPDGSVFYSYFPQPEIF